MEDYEKYVTEQESRTLLGKPIRYTTLLHQADKMNYEEFVNYLHNMGLQDNLRDGERFIEEWIEIFLAYHEIEQADEDDIKYNAKIIDINYDHGSFNRIFGFVR